MSRYQAIKSVAQQSVKSKWRARQPSTLTWKNIYLDEVTVTSLWLTGDPSNGGTSHTNTGISQGCF